MAIYRDGSIDENWATIPNALFRSGFPLRVVAVLGNLLTHRPDFPVTVKLMAEQLGVTPKTVTQAINDLEELGLVERVPVPGEPGKFGRNDKVAVALGGIFGVVVLVVVLSNMKLLRRVYLSDHMNTHFIAQLADHTVDGWFLRGFIGIKNHRRVLPPHVIALAVLCGWVMGGKKDIQNRF